MAKLTPNMIYRLQRPIWIGSGGSGERCFHEKACPGQLHRQSGALILAQAGRLRYR